MSFRRFIGGSPLGVAVRLVVMSVLVGALLSFLGLTPRAIVAEALDAARALWAMGYDAMDRVVEYLLVGAIVVVPLWLISRLIKSRD